LTDNTANEGGAIYCDIAPIKIYNSIIKDNTTFLPDSSGGEGGGLFIHNPEMTTEIGNSTFLNNKSEEGGAVFLADTDALFESCIFDGNSTEGKGPGGAVYMVDSTSSIFSCSEIVNNISANGGGFYCENSTPEIIGCNISGNKLIKDSADVLNAWVWGGGMTLTNKSHAVIRNTNFIGNVIEGFAIAYGGGIYCNEGSSPTIIGCEIRENSSLWGSGIACNNSSSPTIRNTVITGNYALDHPELLSAGGGVYSGNNASPTISNSIISENRADYGAGSHCFNHAAPEFKNALIVSNTANYSGGAVCADLANPTFTNCTMADNGGSGI